MPTKTVPPVFDNATERELLAMAQEKTPRGLITGDSVTRPYRFLLVILLLTDIAVVHSKWVSCAQADLVLPPDTVELDGVPAIPKSLAPATADYRPPFSDELIGWDPKKPEPMMIRKEYDRWQIGKIGSPRAVPNYYEYVPRWTLDTYCHPFSEYIIFRKDHTSGFELTQLYRYDL